MKACILCGAEYQPRKNGPATCEAHRSFEWQRFYPGYRGRLHGVDRAARAYWLAGYKLQCLGFSVAAVQVGKRVKKDRLFIFASGGKRLVLAVLCADLDAHMRYALPINRLKAEYAHYKTDDRAGLHAALVMLPPDGVFRAYNMTRYRDLAAETIQLPHALRDIELEYPRLQFTGDPRDLDSLRYEAIQPTHKTPLRLVATREQVADAEEAYDAAMEGPCVGE